MSYLSIAICKSSGIKEGGFYSYNLPFNPHHTIQFPLYIFSFTSIAKIAHAGIKRQGYTSGRDLFAFSGPARILRLMQIIFL